MMPKIGKSVSTVKCVAIILCFLAFVETTKKINSVKCKNNLEKRDNFSVKNDLLSKVHFNALPPEGPNGNRLRRRRNTSLHERKHGQNDLTKRIKKQSEISSGGNKKRDFFFRPESPFSQMITPRRIMLIRRGGRGSCFSHACHHGGMCRARRHGFYCECLPGFMGTRCEVKKECKPTTCKNGGTCTEIALGRHLCTCPVGFLGDNCEERSFCHPSPCLNGGTCTEIDESYMCVCAQGYKGKNCETVNKCSPNPCKNMGTCSEFEDDYVCNCPQGFKGKTCEVKSECSSVYCLNGGTCRDEPTGYHCDCQFGFYGKRCEASACHPNPCQNDGACLRFGNQSFCQCKTGYSGKGCEVKKACTPSLCLNGGTCVDGSHTNSQYGFACICLNGYDGIICEKQLPQENTLDHTLVAK
ncbi:uncharacterized protein [Porites lutea]|uniref:uncharacterized protein n=1 Tax=Porites lutea TaxID=51062 RepID=UPI003CC5101A